MSAISRRVRAGPGAPLLCCARGCPTPTDPLPAVRVTTVDPRDPTLAIAAMRHATLAPMPAGMHRVTPAMLATLRATLAPTPAVTGRATLAPMPAVMHPATLATLRATLAPTLAVTGRAMLVTLAMTMPATLAGLAATSRDPS
jgi:hypothetical protein